MGAAEESAAGAAAAERVCPSGRNRRVDRNARQINKREHVLTEKVRKLFKNMLQRIDIGGLRDGRWNE